MRESGYYAPGTEFRSDAPWNQVEAPECDFDVTVSFSLERECSITTDQVYCDDGDWCLLDDADIWKEYNKDYASIPEMLEELVKFIDKELEHLGKLIKARTANKQERERYHLLKKMKDSATGWKIMDREMEV